MHECQILSITQAAPAKWIYGFWSRVEVRKAHQCWEWRGSRNRSDGYGRLKTPTGGEWVYAHRVSYVLHHSAPLAPLYACHTCDNPICCNPYHLYAGSQRDNMQDRVREARSGPLSDQEKKAVLDLHHEGLSNTEIAGLVDVKQSTVSRQINGRR